MEDLEGTVVAARGIRKHYGGIAALDDVSLGILPGEIHALVGENGAGKSTLVKILTGAVSPDAGELVVNGETLTHLTTERALEHGIGAVYQEPSLVLGLTVLENMFLARELHGRLGLLARKTMKARALAALERVGADVRPSCDVGALSVAERQLVEIARALMFEAQVLIFDEPSAILSGQELDRVFAVIEELRASGLAILYISHRLVEIFRLCDRATVLKDGKVVATRDVSSLTTDDLIRLMVGRDIGQRPARAAPSDRVVLEVRDLQLRAASEPVSFELRAGEVLGVAGLIGSGRSRLASAIGGIRPARGGEVLRDGRPVRLQRPADAVEAGIAVIPEDRKGEGLILDQSIRANVGLASLRDIARLGVVSAADERRLAEEAVTEFGIRPALPEALTRNLSGGNQQKVVLAKWLVREPPPGVAILDEPTRGVDVGAKFEIYRLIDELVAGGAGVLLISSELPEVIAMSDRILVMSDGQVAGILEREEFSEERILTLALLGRVDADAHDRPASLAAAESVEGARG